MSDDPKEAAENPKRSFWQRLFGRAPAPAADGVAPPAARAPKLQTITAEEAARHRKSTPAAGVRRGRRAKEAAPIVGIDFGTSYSSVSVVRDGQIEIVRFEDGEAMIPSVVSFPGPDVVLVGAEARERMGGYAQWTIASPKRLLGRPYADPDSERQIAGLAFRSFAGSDQFLRIEAHGGVYSVIDVCAMLLEKLRERASVHLGADVSEAVFSAPVSFGSLQRSALEAAARRAGLRVVNILSEPTAAVVAHGFGSEFFGKVAVFDFGGGTFDFCVLEVNHRAYQVLCSGGDPWLGGDDFDAAIANYAADAFWKQVNVDLRQRAVEWQALLFACERAKRVLTRRRSAKVSAPDLIHTADGMKGVQFKLSRKDFNALTESLVQRSIDTTERVMHQAKIPPRDVDAVVLTGGTALIPAVRDAVAKLFGKRPQTADAHLAVVKGNAIRAAEVSGEPLPDFAEARQVKDVAGRSFGASMDNGPLLSLFERDTPVPAECDHTFVTSQDGQQEMALCLFEQSTSRVDQSRPIGRLFLRGIRPARAGAEQVTVTFILDEDGLFTVSAEVAGQQYTQTIRTR